MFGVSVLKIVSYDGIINWGLLITGMVVSYLVSMVAIKFLMNYVRNHTFSLFGWYRIILAAVVIGYFLLIA